MRDLFPMRPSLPPPSPGDVVQHFQSRPAAFITAWIIVALQRSAGALRHLWKGKSSAWIKSRADQRRPAISYDSPVSPIWWGFFFPLLTCCYLAVPHTLSSLAEGFFPPTYLKEANMKHGSELLGVSLHSAGRNPPVMHQSETREMWRGATQTAYKSRRGRSTWTMSATEGHWREAVGSDGSGDGIINQTENCSTSTGFMQVLGIPLLTVNYNFFDLVWLLSCWI